jgi:hypothetical protein
VSKRDGVNTAIERAVAELRTAELDHRWANLGLAEPRGGGVELRLFGIDARLDTGDWKLVVRATGEPVRPTDRLLLLHYTMCDLPVAPTGELISFRNLPGGQFYYGPFRARTVEPLIERFGDEIELLRSNLGRFDHELTEHGDLGARIHALGNLWVTLVYHSGDEEFAADADVLFDACVRRAYGAEDAAVMASRICLGLL